MTEETSEGQEGQKGQESQEPIQPVAKEASAKTYEQATGKFLKAVEVTAFAGVAVVMAIATIKMAELGMEYFEHAEIVKEIAKIAFNGIPGEKVADVSATRIIVLGTMPIAGILTVALSALSARHAIRTAKGKSSVLENK